MKAPHVLLIVALAVPAALFFSCCLVSAVLGPPAASPPLVRTGPPASKPDHSPAPRPEPQEPSGPEPALAYRVLHRSETAHFKLALNVEVTPLAGTLPSEAQLRAVAREVYAAEKEHERTFLMFHLPGVSYEASAYAAADGRPENVRFIDVPKRWLLAAGQTAGPPTRHRTVREAYADHGDFAVEGYFEVTDGPSPHVRIDVPVYDAESEDVVERRLRHAVTDAVFRAFIHTRCERIAATARTVPASPPDGRKWAGRTEALSLTREAALAAIRDEDVASFDDLVGARFQDHYAPDKYSDLGDTRLFDDQGPPTLAVVFERLRAASAETPAEPSGADHPPRRKQMPRQAGEPVSNPDAELRLALILRESGKEAAARERLAAIVRRHPGSEAARKAAALLDESSAPEPKP